MMMKRGALIGIVVVIALILFIPFFAYAQGINGWWDAQMPSLKNGDIVTGEWTNFRAAGPNISFLYIFDASENSYSGTAYYIEREAVGGSYVLGNTFSVYIKNNIAVFAGPPSVDDDGQLLEGSTMVLQILDSIPGNPGQMKGFYTKYDIQLGYVKAGPVTARRKTIEKIPEEVSVLVP